MADMDDLVWFWTNGSSVKSSTRFETMEAAQDAAVTAARLRGESIHDDDVLWEPTPDGRSSWLYLRDKASVFTGSYTYTASNVSVFSTPRYA